MCVFYRSFYHFCFQFVCCIFFSICLFSFFSVSFRILREHCITVMRWLANIYVTFFCSTSFSWHRDFICLHTSAYIVVVAQFFLVFLRILCFFFSLSYLILATHKSCVNGVATSFLTFSLFFISPFSVPSWWRFFCVVFSFHVWGNRDYILQKV